MDEPDDARADIGHLFKEVTGLTVEEAAPVVYRAAVRRCRGNRPRAEDLEQSTWLHIFARLRKGTLTEPVSAPTAWLRKVVTHVDIDNARHANAERRNPGQPIKALECLLASAEPASTGKGPEEIAVTNDLRSRFHMAVNSLPDPQREVTLLTLAGHTQNEIAEILGIPLGTAKTRLRNALRNLRAAQGLAADGED